MQGVERYKVRLLAHDEQWGIEFLKAKAFIEQTWFPNILEVHHIGSTAIRGIHAKPILDIAVVLLSLQNMDAASMTDAGYDDLGPQNPEGSRYLFVLRSADKLSLQHIHCYEQGDEDLFACISFKDYLNAHPQDAMQYSALKRKLAQLYPDDRKAYTDAKEEFIHSICRKAALD